MAEILTGVIALFFVLALVIISRNKYVQWLERKLAMARKELKQLRNDRQQPWLTGATTEHHLQKRITELEADLEEYKEGIEVERGWKREAYQRNRYLQKRTKALEAHVPKSVLRRLDAQIK